MGRALRSWFRETPESLRLLAEERLIVAVTELICEAMDERSISRSQLAAELGIKPSEITQRLSGKRNLTLRTTAEMLHALGFELEVHLKDGRGVTSIQKESFSIQEVPEGQPY